VRENAVTLFLVIGDKVLRLSQVSGGGTLPFVTNSALTDMTTGYLSFQFIDMVNYIN
jgi:hypothetical protein